MKRLLLALALAWTCSPAQDLKTRVLTLPANSPVEVRFVDGTRQRGWIGDIDDRGFVLTAERRRQLEKRTVAWQEVRNVKQVRDAKPSHTGRNILIGVAIAVGVIAALILSLATVGGYIG